MADIWIAPAVERAEAPSLADETTTLRAVLDYQRQTFLHKCSGLTADELASRPLPRSTMSLLGLLRHLAGVERWWFRRWFAGCDVPLLFFMEDKPNLDFDGGTPASAPADYATYRGEVRLAISAAADRSLDDTFHRPRGELVTLRWLYLHLIEEYARHNGHADVVREHIDGVTGE